MNSNRNTWGLIAFISFLSGVAIYGAAKSAIHEIYAALLMINSVLGLVIFAIGIGAATIAEQFFAASMKLRPNGGCWLRPFALLPTSGG